MMWQISIDTGGTFTDCLGLAPDGELKRLKILSSSKLRGILEEQLDPVTFKATFQWNIHQDIFKDFNIKLLKTNSNATIANVDIKNQLIRVQQPLQLPAKAEEFELSSGEEVPVLAARLLTSTPLGQNFPPVNMRLGSTKGTNALLERKGANVLFITTKGFKDILKIGNQQRPELFALDIIKPEPLYTSVLEVTERIDFNGNILQPIESAELQQIQKQVADIPRGTAIAIALINSYKNPTHERQLEAHFKSLGFDYISCSSALSPNIKLLPRAETTVANSYLLPVISTYISGIDHQMPKGQFQIMTSSGAIVNAHSFTPKDSLLSGPAGGIVGAQNVAQKSGYDKILTFDMGGTSTDVAMYNQGYDYRYETKVGDAHILSPSLAIETIAAGGGSICSTDGDILTVGPESAGADPGPACYGAGGPLTVTDLNLLCGRLVENNFSIPLNKKRASQAFNKLIAISEKNNQASEPTALLISLLSIANEKMAEAIKKISIRKGHDPATYALVTYGGAGGQHACALAGLLDIETILIPYEAGLLSAYGISKAAVEAFAEKQVLLDLNVAIQDIETSWKALQTQAYEKLIKQGYPPEVLRVKRALAYLRFKGQENTVEIEVNDNTNYHEAFKEAYLKIYGHWLEDQKIEIEALKLIAEVASKAEETVAKTADQYIPNPVSKQECLTTDGWKQAKVFRWERLSTGALIAGPAIVASQNCTVFIDTNWQFNLNEYNQAILKKTNKSVSKHDNPEGAGIELFKNRFVGIVEEMGALMERTSFSVNIKERLDFSCALLDDHGELIANAPHIPVHLGSLGLCVRSVLERIPIREGDIVITNHPAYGGSHLPDITLISAVYYEGVLTGYVANRAHHAEIGGKTPGSMPTDAEQLDQEGVIIEPQYLAHRGQFYWEKIQRLLLTSKYPSRSVHENIADLQGGVAALQAGIQGLKRICSLYTDAEVRRYMELVKSYVSSRLWQRILPLKGREFTATEYLDDGHKLQVLIRFGENEITFDFTGTDQVHPGNLNATAAIVNSVILYVLRLLVDEDLPLNEGLLQQVKVMLPHGLLNPDFAKPGPQPAVVGGNTEVSQRLTDALLKALGLAACSQGTMNNVLFGNEHFGYYETIGGGTGAGNGFNGQDAIHQHMTNTRITDPEILEWRYPVRLKRFEIRKGSGGKGQWSGGNGVIREITFLEPLELTTLCQHRKQAPYGLQGGEHGKTGEQYLLSASGEKDPLKGIDRRKVKAGDRLVIGTPGGGGWGNAIVY